MAGRRNALDKKLQSCRKAAELLGANFALDTTIGTLLRILPSAAPNGVASASEASTEATDERSEERRSRGSAKESDQASSPAVGGSPSAPVLRLTPSDPCSDDPRDTRHRDCTAAFVILWRELRGGEYRVIGGRDGMALKQLIRVVPDLTVEDFRRRAAYALRDEWFRRNGSIAVLCSQWNKWDPPPMQRPGFMGPKARIFAGLDPDGRAIYREA